MRLTVTLDAPCPPATLFTWVDDLTRYPQWLGLVAHAAAVPPHGPDARPAWSVELRGRLGPLARSKRLRMERTVCEPESLALFERAEQDGRSHSPWTLRAEVRPSDVAAPGGSALAMHLHYGGSLFGPVLERVLADEIDRGRARLLALVS